MKQCSEGYFFDTAGTYRIRVQGYVPPRSSGALCDMQIRARRPKGKPVVTTLTGRVVDQASLMGILDTLYDLGYSLLDVKRLAEPPTVKVGALDDA